MIILYCNINIRIKYRSCTVELCQFEYNLTYSNFNEYFYLNANCRVGLKSKDMAKRSSRGCVASDDFEVPIRTSRDYVDAFLGIKVKALSNSYDSIRDDELSPKDLHMKSLQSDVASSTTPRVLSNKRIKGLDGPSAIAITKNGLLAVSEWRGNSVSLVTKESFIMKTFGRRQLTKESIIYNRLSGVPTRNSELHGESIGELHEPTGIAVTKENKIIVVDSKNNRIQLFSITGLPLIAVGTEKDGDIQFNLPYDACLDAGGRIYVSDSFNHQIQVLTPEFYLSHKFGQRGSSLGKFEYPLGMAIDKEGMIYVCDRDNNRVQKMSCYGRCVAEFKHDRLLYPIKVAVNDTNNIVYVSYSFAPEVAMFDSSSGKFISTFCSQTPGGEKLKRPRGIAVDETGDVFVCDTSRNEVWLF